MNATPSARRRSLRDVALRILLALSLMFLFAGSMRPALAADPLAPDLAQIDTTLDEIRTKYQYVQQQMQGKPDDATLIKLRASAIDAASRADKTAALLNPALTSVQARLAELGAAPDGVKEPGDVAAQRAQLTKSSSQLDSQAKLAGLLSVEAEQVAAQVSVLRRTRFQQRLGERTAAILAPDFWSELADDVPQDIGRVNAFGKQLRDAAKTTPTTVWMLVALSILGIGVLRIVAGRLLLNLTATKVPPGACAGPCMQ